MQTRMTRWAGFGLIALGGALSACGPSGSSASHTAAAAAVQQGSEGGQWGNWDGWGFWGGDEWLERERAEQGLAVSPVPIDTSSMGAWKRHKVGLGSYLVNAAGDCSGCHSGPAGYLAGGVQFNLDGQGHKVFSRNLTPDPATGLKLSEAEFKEAIRTGRDFHPDETKMLVVMPWLYLRWESDEDLEAIYAYLTAIPPVANPVPSDNKSDLPLPDAIPFPGKYTDGDVVRWLPGSHRSFDPWRGLAIAPKALPPSVEDGRARRYGVGSYIANATLACSECHTHPDRSAGKVNTADYLTGGTVYATPPPLQQATGYVRATSANLEGAAQGFFSEPTDSFGRFQAIMKTGTLVDETPQRPLAFPMFIIAGSLKNLLPYDLHSLYTYLKRTERTAGASDVGRQPPARWCAKDGDCHPDETCSARECTGGACGADSDCGTCQPCSSSSHTCQAPDPGCVAAAN